MFESLKGLFGSKNTGVNSNSVGKPHESDISVRSPEHVDDLEKLVKIGPVTFILVHADWCGPCQSYKPIWSELERSPGRTANMAMIHHDMVEHSPLLKKAKIPGFPTVLKVYSNGKIEEYKTDNQKTNSVPNIRDKETMLTELKSTPVSKFLNTVSPKNKTPVSLSRTANNSVLKSRNISVTPQQLANNSRAMQANPVNYTKVMPLKTGRSPSMNSRSVSPMMVAKPVTQPMQIGHPVSINTPRPIRISASPPPKQMQMAALPISPVPIMKGGALYTALTTALSRAGPAALLFGASQMLPAKKNTGSNMRLTRKASRSKNSGSKGSKSRKNRA